MTNSEVKDVKVIEAKDIEYSSWDGYTFMISGHYWGRDFPTIEEAEGCGAYDIKYQESASY
jgi:hypothetical protein